MQTRTTRTRYPTGLPATLVAALVAALGACTGDEPDPPGQTPPTSAAPPSPQVGTWTELADLPEPRSALDAVALDGLVYVAGGFAQGSDGRAFYQYDPATDTWTGLAPLPEERHHAPLAAHDGKVYLVGGVANRATPNQAFEGEFSTTATLFIYDVAAGTWRLGPSLPGVVGAHAAVATDAGKIHVLGGIGDRPVASLDQHLVFDPGSETWSTLPPLPTARAHLGAAYLDGMIYTATGRYGERPGAFEAYDIATQEWTTLPDVPTPRFAVTAVAYQGQIYVLGGQDVATARGRDEVERFDPESGTWQAVTPMPTGRFDLGGVALADGILAIGGGPTLNGRSADTEIWRP